LGWYHTEGFNGFEDSDAPVCTIKRSAGETSQATGTTVDASPPAPLLSVASTPTTSTSPSPSSSSTAVTATITTNVMSSGSTACPLPSDSLPPPPPPDSEFIYHMCLKSKWEEAKSKKEPYFPPTFLADGKFTRATVFKADLVATANEYYQETSGEWIVLELNCQRLYGLGIPILAQLAPESTPDQPVKCLQVFGGISTSIPGLVHKIYPMQRSANGKFVRLLEPIAVNKTVTFTTAPLPADTNGAIQEQPQIRKEKKPKKGLLSKLFS